MLSHPADPMAAIRAMREAMLVAGAAGEGELDDLRAAVAAAAADPATTSCQAEMHQVRGVRPER